VICSRSLIRSEPVALIDELGMGVSREMDYLHEAGECRSLRQAPSQHNPRIAVRHHRQPPSRRVLTMKWIDGVKLTKKPPLKAVEKPAGIDPMTGQVGGNCCRSNLWNTAFFHADDPHPGKPAWRWPTAGWPPWISA